MKRPFLQRLAPVAARAVFGSLLLLALPACHRQVDARAQIEARIGDIRQSILEKNADGIVRWGTNDWHFAGPDGRTLDRAAYLQRARALFAATPKIESLATVVDRVDVHGATADVEISQDMRRIERDAGTKLLHRIRLRYREHQTWVLGGDGWRVESVAFLGAPLREDLGVIGR